MFIYYKIITKIYFPLLELYLKIFGFYFKFYHELINIIIKLYTAIIFPLLKIVLPFVACILIFTPAGNILFSQRKVTSQVLSSNTQWLKEITNLKEQQNIKIKALEDQIFDLSTKYEIKISQIHSDLEQLILHYKNLPTNGIESLNDQLKVYLGSQELSSSTTSFFFDNLYYIVGITILTIGICLLGYYVVTNTNQPVPILEAQVVNSAPLTRQEHIFINQVINQIEDYRLTEIITRLDENQLLMEQMLAEHGITASPAEVVQFLTSLPMIN